LQDGTATDTGNGRGEKFMDLEMAEKRALVSGGSRGIGLSPTKAAMWRFAPAVRHDRGVL